MKINKTTARKVTGITFFDLISFSENFEGIRSHLFHP